MKVAIIHIRSVKIQTQGPLCNDSDYGGDRYAAATTTTNGGTTITDPVSIRVFEAPAPDLFNDEAFRVVVAQPISEMPGWIIYPFIDADRSVVGDVLYHVMDASTVEIPPPPTITWFLPITLPTPPLPPILSLRNPLPYRCPPGVIPITMSHSSGEKGDFHGINCFEEHYGLKQNINFPHPFRQWFLRTTIGVQLIPGCEEGKTLYCLDYFLLLLHPNHLSHITLYTSQNLFKIDIIHQTGGK